MIKNELVSEATNKDRSFYRKDYSGAFGYTFNRLPWIGSRGDFSLFAGYRLGKMHHLDSINLTLGNEERAGNVTKEEVNFEAKGPFLGFGASFRPFSNSNSRIGIGGAYGWLEGQYNFSQISNEKQESDLIAEVQDAKGKSLRAYWSSEIAPQLSYTLSVEYYQYSMSLSEQISTVEVSSVEELLVTFKASLNVRFDLF